MWDSIFIASHHIGCHKWRIGLIIAVDMHVWCMVAGPTLSQTLPCTWIRHLFLSSSYPPRNFRVQDYSYFNSFKHSSTIPLILGSLKFNTLNFLMNRMSSVLFELTPRPPSAQPPQYRLPCSNPCTLHRYQVVCIRYGTNRMWKGSYLPLPATVQGMKLLLVACVLSLFFW